MKRFYKAVSVGEADGAFQILLDGKTLKTPSRAVLVLPSRGLAQAVAEEWRGSGETIDTHAMPLTKLAFAALDGVSGNRTHVAEQVLGFGRSDLLSYRAEAPRELVARENASWSPFLDWVDERYGARLTVVTGISYVEQPVAAIGALKKAVLEQGDFMLAALHAATTITGSLVLGLALINGRASAAEIFAAGTLNDAFQAEKWGRDEEADARLARHAAELAAAERFMRLLG